MGSIDLGINAVGWAAKDESGHVEPFNFQIREIEPDYLTLKVLYCGICHTDLHQLRNDYGMSKYPMVAGHEVVGIVTNVGSEVKRFKEGDRVGVGCIVGSCGDCRPCNEDMEQYCPKRLWTYNDLYPDGTFTYGGFANTMVVRERFAIRIPPTMQLDIAAPLLCAGITVYSPMKHFGMTEPGKHCGVIGLGGVGHMAVKFAKAFGLHVTVISTSSNKKKEAIEIMGAHDFLLSTDPEQMQSATQSLDYIIDTIPAPHPLDMYLPLLGMNGKLVIIGVPPAPLQFVAPNIILGRRMIAGSFIGSIKETEEMLEFSVQHNIECMIETIKLDYLNGALDRLEKNEVRYRFVADVANSFDNNHVPNPSTSL